MIGGWEKDPHQKGREVEVLPIDFKIHRDPFEDFFEGPHGAALESRYFWHFLDQTKFIFFTNNLFNQKRNHRKNSAEAKTSP